MRGAVAAAALRDAAAAPTDRAAFERAARHRRLGFVNARQKVR